MSLTGRYEDDAHRQGGRRDGDRRGARVGLLRLLTGLRHLAGDSTHPVAGCGRRRYSAAYRWSAGRATLQSAEGGRCDLPRTEAPMIDGRRRDSRRRPPESPVAAPSLVGGDHVTRPAALVRHETRMRCPTKRVFRTSCRNGAGDVAWPQSGSIAAGFVPITSPSLQVTSSRWKSGLMRR